MSFTLQELLHSELIPELHLLTVPQSFSAIPIEAVSIQSIYDVPVKNFIHKNDLVLVSALGRTSEEETYLQFVCEAHDAGAGAITVSFQTPEYQLSEDIIHYANTVGLPIFTISWDIRFSDIQDAVNSAIRYSRTRVITELQTLLFNLSFDSQSLDAAAEAISQKLHLPVRITNLQHEILGASKLTEDILSTEPLETAIDLNGTTVGYLELLQIPNGEEVYPESEMLSRFVCFPLSLWFYRKNIEDMTITRIKNDFVWNLANQNYSSFEEMAYQAHQLHFDLSRPYTCLLLEIRHPDTPEGRGIQYINDLAAKSDEMQSLLSDLGKSMHLKLMFSSRMSQTIIYLENRPAQDNNIEFFISKIEQALTKHFPESNLYWGISECVLDPVNFSTLYDHAVLALSYSLHSKNQQYRFTYQDTKQAQITVLLSNDSALKADAHAVIETLNSYSDPSGIDLFGTLVTFIQCNYNTSLTARQLYIHRQSLLYRLSKIEELTGMSLRNHRDLFLLEIYSHIYTGY